LADGDYACCWYAFRQIPKALSVNRTQGITAEWLQHSGLVGNDLLLEALLRRGFLVYLDDDGLWLGTGSHPKDLTALQSIGGLTIQPIVDHNDRMACIKATRTGKALEAIALSIIELPENHFNGHSMWTGMGLGHHMRGTWGQYVSMKWGAKMAVCPMQTVHQKSVANALDLGVALLVKTFSLARVATTYCCDGHGERPAEISFHFKWDVPWANCVFKLLGLKAAHSNWTWLQQDEGNLLLIEPCDGFADVATKGMLDDIQHFARRLLDSDTIDKIGSARSKTLAGFDYEPTVSQFSDEAERQLHAEFIPPIE
jgi:hypothetical protein